MYNKEIKERFFEEHKVAEITRYRQQTLFNQLAPFEERQGKDVCAMEKGELQQTLKEAINIGSHNQAPKLSDLRTYIRWCIDNNIPGACDAFFSLNKDDLINTDKVALRSVASPQHLKMVLDFIFGDESRQNLKCMSRAFLWLAYGGMINPKDAMNIKNSDVDLDNMVVIYEDNEYPIYREGLKSFKDSVERDKTIITNRKHPDKERVIQVLNRVDSDYLFRTTAREQSLLEDFNIKISKAVSSARARATDKDKNVMREVSFTRMWKSGVFYRMYEAERLGMPVNFEDVAIQLIKASGQPVIADKKQKRMRGLEQDYNVWKQIYSVNN